MIESGTADRLKKREGLVFAQGPRTVAGLRVHRAVSWIGRAEQAGDADGRFLFLWIAFNALYAEDHESDDGKGEWQDQHQFFQRIVSCRHARKVHEAVWDEYYGPIRSLLENRYAFKPYWKNRNGISGFEEWRSELQKFQQRIQAFLVRSATVRTTDDTLWILDRVFERLYVVRNQLLHGGATWGGRLNRTQVEDGAAILGSLVPAFVDLVLDHPKRHWGRPHYAPGPGWREALGQAAS